MFALAALSLMLGAVVGLRFKAWALVPAIALCLAVAFGARLAYSVDGWGSVAAGAVAVVAPQIGYLAGSAVRFLSVSRRSGRHPQAPSNAAKARPNLQKTG